MKLKEFLCLLSSFLTAVFVIGLSLRSLYATHWTRDIKGQFCDLHGFKINSAFKSKLQALVQLVIIPLQEKLPEIVSQADHFMMLLHV